MKIKYFILIVVLFFIFILPSIVHLLTDWFWFQEIGFENIFITILSVKVLLGLIVGLITFTLIYFNLKIACLLTKHKPVLIALNQRAEQIDIGKHIGKIILYFSLLIGFFTGLAEVANWNVLLKYLNSTSFGALDPIFNRDISFYFFTLPFLKIVIGFLLWIALVSIVGSALIYFIKGAFPFLKQKSQPLRYFFQGKTFEEKIEKKPRVHLLLMFCFFLLTLAAQTYFIKIPNLLYSSAGSFTGANFTDIHARLPVLKLLSLIFIIGAIVCFINIFKEKYRLLSAVIGAYLGVVVLGGLVYPIILQKFIVDPNELVKESPYISNNIEGTQKAFKLDKVEERKLEGETSLTMEDIKANQATIKNVRLWDREPLLDTFGQMQEIRTYYDFTSIDNDRYLINGEYRQILLSPRELNSQNLPHRTFINKYLTFTHGFGLTLSPVNEVTQEGLPELFVKDLPPTSTVDSLKITRPEIYFGELTKDYVVVNTKAKEFDYPSGEENVFCVYQGKGGVPIHSFLRKFLMAVRFKEPKLLFSSDITPESRIMYYRNIKERVKQVLPFLRLDNDPYLVINSNGELKWIYDAYTVSNLYPYSERVGGLNKINYIRNSVKIVIDAYNGKMQFYIADPEDPLIQTYAKIFKNSFLPLKDMPKDIVSHLRYPEDIFVYQTALYAVYHMEEPQIFYNKEDKWQVPVISEGEKDSMMRHIIMKLPEEMKEEFILMIPFTPQGKDNLSAWMVARSDKENYGKLAVYYFPKQKLVFGPKQIINRINQDPEISAQISLWDQRGSKVNQGPLLVIPIKESLLYIRPLYIRAEGGKIPELKRVIVALENKIAMEKTLEDALNKIFKAEGEEFSKEEIEKEAPLISQKNLIFRANQYYQQAIQAQKQGNWTLYGEKIKELGKILQQLK
ncbi:MAG: UPF0182 family protein [Patescibacteria group bacterium]|nr:UPF0182 family protein [Patescibacteria group bacterium]